MKLFHRTMSLAKNYYTSPPSNVLENEVRLLCISVQPNRYCRGPSFFSGSTVSSVIIRRFMV